MYKDVPVGLLGSLCPKYCYLRSLQAVLFVERQVIGWFEILEKGCCQKECFPVGIVSGDIGEFYYFPEFEQPGMKIGKFDHMRERVEDPARLDCEIREDDEQASFSSLGS